MFFSTIIVIIHCESISYTDCGSLTGFMFHRKPLYVALAQRKEERQAQLQIQYAQQMAGLAGPSAVMPGAYPPIYYPAPPGVVPQVPARPALMYQSAAIRPGWRPNGFPNSARPGFQPSPVPLVSSPTTSALINFLFYTKSSV